MDEPLAPASPRAEHDTVASAAPVLNLRIALLGAAGFLVAVSWQFVTPVLPVYLANIGYSASTIGILASLLSLTMGLVESDIGRIAAALGQRSALVAGLVVSAAAMAWIVLARTVWGVAGG